MTRVFHIVSRFDVGGAERVAINIARCKDCSVEQHIVELQRGQSDFTKSIVEELKSEGIRYHRSLIPVKWHLGYYVDRLVSLLFPIRFLLLWLRYHPDVVHTHTEMPDMAVWWSLRIFPFIKIKVVRSIHNTTLWTGMDIIGPQVENFMQKRKANVAISLGVAEAYFKKYNESVPIIYNGVEVPDAPNNKRRQFPPIHVLFAGRFEQQKGIDVLCEIICRLQDDKRYVFHVHGSGRLENFVKMKLKSLVNVELGKPIENLANKMSDYDYMLMPSLHEGLSIVAIEASMNGLPLLINDCLGLSDTLPEAWPLKVKGNDIGQWMALFEEILPHVDRQNLVEDARNFAQERFSIERMQSEYIRMYKIHRE